MGKRTDKNLKNLDKKKDELDKMIRFLEEKYKRKIKYSCIHCLQHAYKCELSGTYGYVTDDDLIESSNNTLRHK